MTSTNHSDHPLILNVRSFLQDRCAWNPNDSIVVAVSGGPDSVALLLALTVMYPNPPDAIIIAHFNHLTRRDESTRDALFVQNLAHSLSIRFVMGSLQTPVPRGISKEHFWRQERYRFLESVRVNAGARFIATGHTRDDQTETILFRLLTGASSGSLRGIAPVRSGTVIRPLLYTSRADITTFLESLGQVSMEDRSNSDSRHPRNYIRRCIIPLIHSINPSIENAISNLIESHTVDSQYFSLIITPLIGQITVPGTIPFPQTGQHLSDHAAFTRRYAARILERVAEKNGMRVAGTMVQNLSDVLNGNRQRMSVPYFLIKWHRHSIWIVPCSPPPTDSAKQILVPGEPLQWDRYRLSVTTDRPGRPDCCLAVRTPVTGDRISVEGCLVPLMKMLTEKGLPSELRRCVPVITDAFDRIGAVVLPGLQESLIRTCFLPDYLQLQWEII